MDNFSQGSLIVFSGPSGAGKDSILQKVIGKMKNLKLSVSYTTRSPRQGEVDGKDYFFVSKEEFLNMVNRGEMLEYAHYCDNYYGTSALKVQEELNLGNDVVLEIEVQGAKQVIGNRPESLSIFIVPPCIDDLRKRLSKRATDSKEVIDRRVEEAEKEISLAYKYDYVVVNDNLGESVEQVLKIIDSQREKVKNIKKIIDEVLGK